MSIIFSYTHRKLIVIVPKKSNVFPFFSSCLNVDWNKKQNFLTEAWYYEDEYQCSKW